MLLTEAIDYFKQATRVCPIPSDDFYSAFKYAYNTGEALENLESIYMESPNLGIFESFKRENRK